MFNIHSSNLTFSIILTILSKKGRTIVPGSFKKRSFKTSSNLQLQNSVQERTRFSISNIITYIICTCQEGQALTQNCLLLLSFCNWFRHGGVYIWWLLYCLQDWLDQRLFFFSTSNDTNKGTKLIYGLS